MGKMMGSCTLSGLLEHWHRYLDALPQIAKKHERHWPRTKVESFRTFCRHFESMGLQNYIRDFVTDIMPEPWMKDMPAFRELWAQELRRREAVKAQERENARKESNRKTPRA